MVLGNNSAIKDEPTISHKMGSNIHLAGTSINTLIDALKNKTSMTNVKQQIEINRIEAIYDGIDNQSNSIIG